MDGCIAGVPDLDRGSGSHFTGRMQNRPVFSVIGFRFFLSLATPTWPVSMVEKRPRSR